MASALIKLDSRSITATKQSSILQVVDPRTDNQRRNRKRKDTHQIHQGAKREIATEYPRFTPSSEACANRAGVTRFAVLDAKQEEFERRVLALELRLGPKSEGLGAVQARRRA